MRVAPGAWRPTAIPLVLTLPAVVVYPPASVILVLLAVAIVVFYRDPRRTPPTSGVVAPADGTVTVVREEGDQLRIGVFMNVTDVHVNRAPLPTTIEDTTHEPGTHRPAFRKESDRNERLIFDCGDHEVTLIAGWFARRIHPYVDPGTSVERGERIGHIAFGSRADVLLPTAIDRSDLIVETGDSVRAGETVIAPDPDAD